MKKRLGIAVLAICVVAVLGLCLIPLAEGHLRPPKFETTAAGDLVPVADPNRFDGHRAQATGVEPVGDSAIRVSFDARAAGGRSCERYYPIVVEDAETVWFTIAATPVEHTSWFNCDIDGGGREQHTMLLQLASPIGDREVVDAMARPVTSAGDELPAEQLWDPSSADWISHEVLNDQTIRLHAERVIGGEGSDCMRSGVEVEYGEDLIEIELQHGWLPHAEELCKAVPGGLIRDMASVEPYALLVELDEQVAGREIVDAYR